MDIAISYFAHIKHTTPQQKNNLGAELPSCNLNRNKNIKEMTLGKITSKIERY